MTDDELDAIEAKARAAGGHHWVSSIREAGKRPRAHLFAYRDPKILDGDSFVGLVAAFWDDIGVSAAANAEFAEAADPAAVLALVAEIRRLRRSPWEIARRLGEAELADGGGEGTR